MAKIHVYECDPEKNTECSKRICFACEGTCNPDFARLNEFGNPKLAFDEWEDEDDYDQDS